MTASVFISKTTSFLFIPLLILSLPLLFKALLSVLLFILVIIDKFS